MVFCVLSSICCFAHAIDAKPTEQKLSDEEKQKIVSDAHFTMLNGEPEKGVITWFDVNEDGLIAITSFHTVCVYDKSGAFLRGYSVVADGAVNGFWSGSTLVIYFVRSSVAILISPNGKIDDVSKILDTAKLGSGYNRIISSVKRVGNKKYTSRNDYGNIINVFAQNYSQLVLQEADGTDMIIYSASENEQKKQLSDAYMLLALIIIITAALGATIIVLIKNRKKHKNQGAFDHATMAMIKNIFRK